MTYEEKSEIAKKAHTLIKDMRYSAHVCGFINFSNLAMSPEYVMVEPLMPYKQFAGGQPKWDEATMTREQYRALNAEWKLKAQAEAAIEFKEVLRRLKKAKIQYRSGKQYGWPVARLA